MKTLQKLVSSRTVWTLVVLFVFNGLQAIAPQVPATYSEMINAVLSIMAIYFKISPSQKY